jgi:uncharacterized OsmC-like protein
MGAIDIPAAAVLVALFVCVAVAVTTWIGKNRTHREIEIDYELNKIKQADATKLEATRIASKWAYENKKVEQGLITSHRDTSGGDGD